MGYSFYDYLYFFAIYAVVGWCIEEIYNIINTGVIVNRGFLNGPLCPIYGFGMILIITCLQMIPGGVPVIFLGGFILASALEFITGFLLEKIFHQKWWDYSEEKFNLHGYICLKYSLYWALGAILVMDVVHPVTERFVGFLPHNLGVAILISFYILFTTDCIVTALSMRKFDKKLRAMQEVADRLKQLSDGMSEAIGKNITKSEEARIQLELMKMDAGEAVKRKRDEMKEAIESAGNSIKDLKPEMPDVNELKQRYEELKARYAELAESKSLGSRRLLKAFPSLKNTSNKEALESLKKINKKDKSSVA